MTTYAVQWKKAKTDYETSTGKKKPSESDGKWYDKIRSKSGVADCLTKIDKLMPDNLAALPPKEIAKIEALVADAARAADRYVVVVKTAIDKEKALGKESSAIYRDLKVLRGKLETIIKSIQLDLAKFKAASTALVDGARSATNATYITIKTLGAGIDKNAKQAMSIAQEMLKDPTPATYNTKIQKAARDLTQCLNNVSKWSMPEDLGEAVAERRLVQMADPGVAKAVEKLITVVEGFQAAIREVTRAGGATPANATLSTLATGNIHFPPTATTAEVIVGVKHLIAQVKAAVEVRKLMKL